ncbi:NifU family protein [bacterium SCSIO 12643]|nr:NifU family protein [bacterium SCSIO 12643]
MKTPISIYAEMTPNPKAMKFVANMPLLEDGVFEYESANDATNSPLAKVLFTFPFVQSVMISFNFVTITIVPSLEWDDVVMEVREYLTNYLQAGQPIMDENVVVEVEEKVVEKEAEFTPLPKPGEVRDIDKKIKHILREYVSPAVENDGGAISFESFEDGELKVKLSGACNGCPSSNQTLQYGIQNIFEKLLPQVKKVSSV